MDNLLSLGSLLCSCLCPLIIFVPLVIGFWKVFEKAGRPGWEAIVPVYNLYILTIEIAKKDIVTFLLAIFIFPVGYVLIGLEVARRFGKEQGFGIGLGLLPFIFYPILGFSKDAVYDSSPGASGGGSGRPRRRDEYDDE